MDTETEIREWHVRNAAALRRMDAVARMPELRAAVAAIEARGPTLGVGWTRAENRAWLARHVGVPAALAWVAFKQAEDLIVD